jgi:hypothetical protein
MKLEKMQEISRLLVTVLDGKRQIRVAKDDSRLDKVNFKHARLCLFLCECGLAVHQNDNHKNTLTITNLDMA